MFGSRPYRISLVFQLLLAVILLTGCFSRITKYVPEKKHLLVKNKIIITGEKLDEDELDDVIKQQPNTRMFGFRWRLRLYNMMDSVSVEKSRIHKLNRIKRKNYKRLNREYRINTRRRDRAISRGDSTYIYKTIKLKDTLDPSMTIKQLIKYKFGEPPAVADSFLMNRSRDQVEAYMHSKGYFNPIVTASFDTLHRKFNKQKLKRKVRANYFITTNDRYYIDTVKYVLNNPSVENDFVKFLKKYSDRQGFNVDFEKSILEKKSIKVGFDAGRLDAYRTELARYMRDKTYYGFLPTNVSYKADTTGGDKRMTLTILFGDRIIQDLKNGDSILSVKHRSTSVQKVYFHICDTAYFDAGYFSHVIDSLNKEDITITKLKNDFIYTLDTFDFKILLAKVENKPESEKQHKLVFYKSEVYKNVFGQYKDSIDVNKLRMATFTYNGVLFVRPELIETQNYLEHSNYYKEYYLERSFSRLVELGLFSVVKPVISETYPGSGVIDVHYYLVPATRQNFSFEPRAKNANGFLGLSASINYGSKNIFRTGVGFVTSVSGGFESNPSVFGKDENGNTIKTQERSFNTFEIGPSVKLDIPGLFPVGITKLGKRQRPRTEISLAYNYQNRTDFTRGVFQFNYLYKFFIGDGRTQVVSFGLPAMSVVKFVSLNKMPDFEAKINAVNDLFLKNSYSDQVIWEDFKMTYEFDNQNKNIEERKYFKLRVNYSTTISVAGNILAMTAGQSGKTDSLGRSLFLGIPYSQFSLIDNKVILSYRLSKTRSINFRTLAGVGVPGKNSSISLPYDYSFFAGGANENRGWVARSLGPGSYNRYLDTQAVATQIGDLRFSVSLEYRFGTGFFKHAFFTDASNIWTMKYDPNRIGSQISKNWIKELGVTVGYGLRLDFTYFLFRLDLGWKIHEPGLPAGERWVFQSKNTFHQYAEQVYGSDWSSHVPLVLYPIRINFGIGLPF